MRTVRLAVAALALAAAACGGSSGNPVAAGGATIALSTALGSALAASQNVRVRETVDEALRLALPDLGRTAATSANCTGGCTGTTGTATASCNFSATAVSCQSGGSASLSGTMSMTMNCANTSSYSANYNFSLSFTNCASSGVTLSGPVTMSGSVTAAGAVSASMKSSGLTVKGSVCGQTLNETCAIDFNVSESGTNFSYSGSICGCDVTKLAQSADMCKASC